MAITYTTTLQNQIALRVAGVQNSALDAGDKIYLDNTWTSGSLTSGSAAKLALDRVNQMAQWFNMAGATDAPDAWEDYFVAYASLRFAMATRPERVESLRKIADDAREECMSAFSRSAITAAYPGSGTETTSLTVQNIRYFVVANCVRRNPRLFPPIETIDAAIDSVNTRVWNGYRWHFAKAFVTMTVPSATPTVPTFSDSASFRANASREWWYDDDSGKGAKVTWGTEDEVAAIRAYWGSTTGRPSKVNVTRVGDTIVWNFAPLPDQDYTLKGFCYITGPGNASSVSDTTPFARFPAIFRPVLRRLYLAEVLQVMGAPDGEEKWNAGIVELEGFLPDYATVGEIASDGGVRDGFGDIVAQAGENRLGGAM